MAGTARRLVVAGALASALLVPAPPATARPQAVEPEFDPQTLVIDLAPFTPFYAGELAFVHEYAGQVVGAELDVKLVSQETDPWAVTVTFGLATGGLSLSTAQLGWQGAGTFETQIVSHALDGLIPPPPGAYQLIGFMAWSTSVDAGGPGGGVGGPEPFDGVFEVLRLTVHFAPCPYGHPQTGWEPLGGGLAGPAGTPRLSGSGSLCPGEPGELRIDNGPAAGAALLVAGLAPVQVPLLGGTLVPSPDLLLDGILLDANGAATLPFAWPAGAAPGLELWLQTWLIDPAAALGLSATNGLRARAPGPG